MAAICRAQEPVAVTTCSAVMSPLLVSVSYTHLRAHETVLDLVCRLLLEKTKKEKEKIAHNLCL